MLGGEPVPKYGMVSGTELVCSCTGTQVVNTLGFRLDDLFVWNCGGCQELWRSESSYGNTLISPGALSKRWCTCGFARVCTCGGSAACHSIHLSKDGELMPDLCFGRQAF